MQKPGLWKHLHGKLWYEKARDFGTILSDMNELDFVENYYR